MKILNRQISNTKPPFIIAEMSGNHNKSIDRALKIVEEASKAGVNAIKMQTYTADTLTLNIKRAEFMINDEKSLWKGRSLYDLYNEASTPWEWQEKIMKKANDLGLICFSTPFDESSVDFLEDIKVPAYKIASFENIHRPLIKKVAKTGKPIIISTGMASISDIDKAVKIIKEFGVSDFALLKCTSTYPALPVNSNVLTIPHMKNLFNCEIGISDHTMGIGASIAAVAHGATIIEKHFTLDRSDGGVDSKFSLEPSEIKQLVIESKRAWQALGKIQYGTTIAEKDSLKRRRSIYIAEGMKRNDVFSKNNLRIIRPGNGLHPKYYEIIMGMKINKNVRKGTPLSWDLIK